MDYPNVYEFEVNHIYGDEIVKITVYSGLTVFVGPNASGKTQTLKSLRNSLKRTLGADKVRYLSSNRIGQSKSN